MNDDNRNITSLYESSASINDTTRHNDSYLYLTSQDYNIHREDQEEISQKRKIVSDLEYCLRESKIAKKENFQKILFTIRSIQKDVEQMLDKNSK